jgi:hypothetical protein
MQGFERDARLACLAMTIIAVLVPGGGARAGLGVLGGGLLAAVSYRGLKNGVWAASSRAQGRVWALVKFFTRYAILAIAAYVMLARLRLPPMAVMAGASSLLVAVGVAAVRAARSVSRPGDPR